MDMHVSTRRQVFFFFTFGSFGIQHFPVQRLRRLRRCPFFRSLAMSITITLHATHRRDRPEFCNQHSLTRILPDPYVHGLGPVRLSAFLFFFLLPPSGSLTHALDRRCHWDFPLQGQTSTFPFLFVPLPWPWISLSSLTQACISNQSFTAHPARASV